jgi:hypothetical protein
MCFNMLSATYEKAMADHNDQADNTYKSFARKRPKPRDAEGRVIKGLSRIRWANDADEDAELAEARNSPYYWWWAFLKESAEYRRSLSGRSEEPYASMARDFGRLGNDFDYWWLRTGREIFAEQMALPRVRELEHGVTVNLDQINPKLVLELPLTIRRSTILRQINEFLDKYHQGAKLRVMKHGTARRKLFAQSRMRLTTLKVLHDVWTTRKNFPQMTWWEIGEALGVSRAFDTKLTDTPDERAYKHRCMTLVVQRHCRKATALIDFAAKGDFPRIK